MFSELDSVLGITQSRALAGKFIGVGESGADGSFIIHHFLSHFLKQETPVCFVSFSQSYNHFNTVSKKTGVGLNQWKDSKQLRFIEGLRLVGESLIEENTDVKGDNPFRNASNSSFTTLKTLYSFITNVYQTLKNSFPDGYPVIIFDDLSVLSNIGYKEKDIVSLLCYLQEIISDTGSLVVLVDSGKTNNDEDAQFLWKHICHSCSLKLEVKGLKSGYCRDVHGEIQIQWLDSLVNKPSKTMQFKLTEKNVALFAAGTSSAVL